MTPVLTTQDGLKYGEGNADQSVQHMFNTRAVPSSSTLAPGWLRRATGGLEGWCGRRGRGRWW